MINELLTEYIISHTGAEPDYLRVITHRTEQRAINPRMSSGHVPGRILAFISKLLRPERILEIGTFSGYSALCLAEGLQEKGKLTTIEINDEQEDFIRENLSLAPLGKQIELLIGSAEHILPNLKAEQYDIIYLDADKRRYIEDYELVIPLLRQGGIILADNTLWDGHICDPAYSKDPQTTAIRKFNDYLMNDNRIEHVLLPIRDGLTIIRKLQKE